MRKINVGLLMFAMVGIMHLDVFAASSVRMLGTNASGQSVSGAIPAQSGTGAPAGRRVTLPIVAKTPGGVKASTGLSGANRLAIVPIGTYKNTKGGTGTTTGAGTGNTTGAGTGAATGAGTSGAANTALVNNVLDKLDTLEQKLDGAINLKVYSDWDAQDSVDAVSAADAEIVSRSFVQGAYDELNATKQDRLNIARGSGAFVTGITASDGDVTVETGEITIPTGDANGPDANAERVQIWFEKAN